MAASITAPASTRIVVKLEAS